MRSKVRAIRPAASTAGPRRVALVGALLVGAGLGFGGCFPKDDTVTVVPLERGAEPTGGAGGSHEGHNHPVDAGFHGGTDPAMPRDANHAGVASGPAPMPMLPGGESSIASPPPSDVVFQAPSGWIPERPSSSMRTAQIRIPKVKGDLEDAQVVVYFFGGMAGGIKANVQRWMQQFTQPDGSAMSDHVKLEGVKTIGGFDATLIEITGSYVAETTPGSGVRVNKTGWMLMGAIVAAGDKAYFVKGLGPQKTLEAARADMRAYVLSASAK